MEPWIAEKAAMNALSRGFLWHLSGITFIRGDDLVPFVSDYDSLLSILWIIQAEWATAAPGGLIITDRGREVASQLFVDRAWS